MSVVTGPNIVTNGLVMSFDPDNYRCYPGTGSTWTDVSGRGHGSSLINSPTYVSSASSSYLSFNGSTSRGRFILGDNASDFYSSTLSLAGLARLTTANYGDGWLFDLDYVGFRLWGGSNTPFMVRGPSASWETSTSYSFTINQWYYVCATMIDNASANNVNVYINGVLYSTQSFGLKNIGPQAGIVDGALSSHYGGSTPMPFDVSCIQKYNRVLSADEVMQNFNAVRGRVGI